jgi:hypothetical protein
MQCSAGEKPTSRPQKRDREAAAMSTPTETTQHRDQRLGLVPCLSQTTTKLEKMCTELKLLVLSRIFLAAV